MLIPDLKSFIDENSVKYKRAISESTWFKIGAMINFIGHRNHQEKQFFMNGPYWVRGAGQYKLDGLTVFEFDAEIFSVWAFNIKAGTSGTTELDVRLKPQNAGAFTSIFSIRPAFNYLAGDDKWVTIGDSISNVTAPVLTSGPLLVNRGDALVVDLLQVQQGGENCGILIHYRPR